MNSKNEAKPFVLSPPFCLYNGAIVLKSGADTVTFGLVDKNNTVLKERLQRAAREESKKAQFEYVTRTVIERAVSRLYGSEETKSLDERSDDKNAASENETRAAVILLDSILEEARSRGATDIHIQEQTVRFRINGRLEKMMSLNAEHTRELIQRIKLLAKLNVLEKRRGQDGQFSVSGGHLLCVRVSVVPAVSNADGESCESVVLRLLDSSRVPLSVDALGFSAAQQKRLYDLAAKENGLVLVCGPTGAGKSTTAAALLCDIVLKSNGSKKIITLEDPPEYVLSGVTQIHVDDSLGLDFNSALRLVFRQDPDVLFIGEIRDEQTAQTAVRAALTGHLVFATLHTSGFAETILRLTDLGIKLPFAAQVLRGIVIQKLVHDEHGVKLDAHVCAMNGMTADAVLRADNRHLLEGALAGAAV